LEYDSKTKTRLGVSTSFLPFLPPQPLPPQPLPNWALPELLPLQRLAADLKQFTLLPVKAQQHAVQPLWQAASVQRAEEQRLAQEQLTVQRQIAALPVLTSPVVPRTPLAIPAHPVTVGDWVTVMRHQAEQISGQLLGSRQQDTFTRLQQQTSQKLVHGFRQDRQAPDVRYALYGEQLATLQGHPNSAPVSRVVLNLIPQRERPALQRALDEALQRQADQEAQEQAAAHFRTLQRKKAELEEEALQPVMQRIQARRGTGNPLPVGIQRHLERGLNHELSAVRIHDDAEADKLSRKVNALAFTTGTDIYFQSGRFNPNTQSGLELLAHEVTHTVQQSKGLVGQGIDPDAGLEAQAQATGKRLAAPVKTVKAPLPSLRTSRSGTIQRLASPTDSTIITVRKLQNMLNQGQIKNAVESIKSAPITQQNTLIAMLSFDSKWHLLASELKKAGVQSKALELKNPDSLADPLALPDPKVSFAAALKAYQKFKQQPLADKLLRAIHYAPLAGETKKQIFSLFSVSALVGTAIVFAAMQFTPAGWMVDATIVVISVAAYGPSAFAIGEHLGRFFRMCKEAGNEDQLKQAGGEFAQAFAIAGVTAIGGIIGKAIGSKIKPPTKPPSPTTNTAGLETRGYRPPAGQRTQTQQQYQAQSSRTRLNNLLGSATVKQLKGKLTQSQIEAFIRELGIIETRKVAAKFGPKAMLNYGAVFFKNLKGVTNNTMHHLVTNAGIVDKAIKGCHDKSLFLNELTVIQRPTSTTGKTSVTGKILSTSAHPTDPRITRYTYKIYARDRTGKIQDPSTLTGELEKDKTVIDGLIANQAFWQKMADLALTNAIRTTVYDPAFRDFLGYAGTLKISGFIENGEVSTFFVTW
jgi:hypothetical protein